MVLDFNIYNKTLSRLTIILFSLLFFSNADAQDPYVQGGFGMGTYYMQRLKDFEHGATNGSAIRMENVENFEPYWSYVLKGGKILEKKEIGSNLSFSSTGSRSAYEDYSGYIYFDQIVYGLSIGPYMNFLLRQKANSTFYFGLAANFITSYYKIKESNRILDQEFSDVMGAWSIGGELGFNFSYRYDIHKFFVQPEAGLMINVANSVLRTIEENQKIFYYSGSDQKALKVNWSGIRAFVSVGYYLKSKE